jgi:hypothetical protein
MKMPKAACLLPLLLLSLCRATPPLPAPPAHSRPVLPGQSPSLAPLPLAQPPNPPLGPDPASPRPPTGAQQPQEGAYREASADGYRRSGDGQGGGPPAEPIRDERILEGAFEGVQRDGTVGTPAHIESRSEQGQYSQCSYMCLYCTAYTRCIQCDRRFYLYNGYCQAYQTSSSISWFWILVAVLCCGGCVVVAVKCNSAQDGQPEGNYQPAGTEMMMHQNQMVGNPNMINGYVPPEPLNKFEYQYNPNYNQNGGLPQGMGQNLGFNPNLSKRDNYAQEYGIQVTPFEHQGAPLPPNFLDIGPQVNFNMSKKDQPANLADGPEHQGTNYPKRPSVPPKANQAVSSIYDDKLDLKNKVDANKFLFDSVVIEEKAKDDKKDDKPAQVGKEDKETKKMKESILI